MIRTLHAELVDDLPADHPGAIGTRRDLVRINQLMGHTGILTRALQSLLPKNNSAQMIEIGAGDGEILLRVARRLERSERGVDVTFVDLQELLREDVKGRFAALGWRVRSVQNDVFRWMAKNASDKTDVILANLVLHHFSDAQLAALFSMAAKRASAFIALEPRRSAWPLFCTQWLFLIGCNAVTCHDAPVSVRAGFRGRELSTLWPDTDNWQLTERRAGMFSHLFIARRKV